MNRVAIITGSGRGIGAAIALQLARSGMQIVINDLDKESAEKTAGEIKKNGGKSLVSLHDVSQHQAAQELAEKVMKDFGQIDVLVNNAGILRDAMLHKMSEEHWDAVIRVNLKGVFNVGQACAKKMMEKNYGRIVNISSVAWKGNVGQSNYSAAKAGVLGLTSTWALELAKYQITVNAIAPGFIDTEMTQKVPEKIREYALNRIPLKRMGKPQEIADLVDFLTSDKASYISGQCIHVDGALTTGIGF